MKIECLKIGSLSQAKPGSAGKIQNTKHMKTLSFLRTYLPGYLAFILLGWAGHATLAQTLPVKLVLTVTPPYPVSVSYYADHPQ
ncbi:hypothetical protein [Xanthocytophaga agilis]|uniref:Uncharacterized protein n=1 Tax=Xanthocytophaga agilis TaxID=3048010 RepID=A0AAE3RD16_9BACT|nr:hypothetical protein [Xanthocytophaga agilis]MDJ1506337.1 hypothetical protein [Xanthocytophaga agilis]